MCDNAVVTPSPDSTSAIADLQTRVRGCRLCQEHGYILSAHPIVAGRASDRMLLIGQAPGHVSVKRNLPFSGPSGRILDRWLVRAGFPSGSLHQRVYLSSLTKCDPGKNPHGGGDRKPSPAEIALCRPYLDAELALLRPAVILLLGGMAIEHFLGRRRLHDVIGQSFTSADVVRRPLWAGHEAAQLLPLPHSSGVSRWLNDPARDELLDQALSTLARWREEMQL